jgi:RimJ/RimL family protein N-acetyltransferase
MELVLERSKVRSWRESDAESLARHANDRRIWRNLRDAFPHPYTIERAREWLAVAMARQPESSFAIEVGGEAAGGIGFMLHSDVERVAAEIGYWVAAVHWNRGIASEVLRAVAAFAIARHQLTRVYALPFEWNPASCRVLEKAGFVLEGRLRKSAIKDGQVVDQFMYALVVEEK